jgi:hypothetical protein
MKRAMASGSLWPGVVSTPEAERAGDVEDLLGGMVSKDADGHPVSGRGGEDCVCVGNIETTP